MPPLAALRPAAAAAGARTASVAWVQSARHAAATLVTSVALLAAHAQPALAYDAGSSPYNEAQGGFGVQAE
jgi:hypothetical protein